MNRKLGIIGVMGLVVLVTIGITVNQLNKNQDTRQRASGEKVILSYSPTTIQVAPSTEVLLNLKARTSTTTVNVTGIQTTVKFDPTKLELLRYDEGGKSTLFQLFQTPVPNNAAGSVVLIFTRSTNDTTVATGEINLGKLVFKSKSITGTTTVTSINSIATETGSYTEIVPGVESSTITIATQSTTPTPPPATPTTIPSPTPSSTGTITVQTKPATNITATSAVLSALITTNQPSDDIYAHLGYTTNPSLGCSEINNNYLKVVKKTTTSETISYTRTGLTPATTYYFCSKANIKDIPTTSISGNVLSFTTLAISTPTPTSIPTPTPTRVPTPSPTSVVAISPTQATVTTLTPTSTALTCDPNKTGDSAGKIDLADYETWRNEYVNGGSQLSDCFKRDGKIDLLDFQVWKNIAILKVTQPF